MANWTEWMNAGANVLTGIANITDTTTKTVSVNLGGKPKMLIAKIIGNDNNVVYTLRSWNGEEMILSLPDSTKTNLYETSMIITVTETGFDYYNAYGNSYRVEYTAVV